MKCQRYPGQTLLTLNSVIWFQLCDFRSIFMLVLNITSIFYSVTIPGHLYNGTEYNGQH